MGSIFIPVSDTSGCSFQRLFLGGPRTDDVLIIRDRRGTQWAQAVSTHAGPQGTKAVEHLLFLESMTCPPPHLNETARRGRPLGAGTRRAALAGQGMPTTTDDAHAQPRRPQEGFSTGINGRPGLTIWLAVWAVLHPSAAVAGCADSATSDSCKCWTSMIFPVG